MTLANIKDLWTIARGTVGFSGAELANLVNQAALQASRLQLNNIDLAMLEWAKDKILMGASPNFGMIRELALQACDPSCLVNASLLLGLVNASLLLCLVNASLLLGLGYRGRA